MALFRTGSYVLKTLTPVLTSPRPKTPSFINVQVRNAGRKGYREKKTRQRLAEKRKKLEHMPANDLKQQYRLRNKYENIEKTVNLKKPEPPNDDVFVIENFNYKKYTLAEAIQFHKDYHHPTVFNNPEAPITVRFDINMTGKKETRVIKPFSGIVAISHPFVITHAKDVLVFCKPQDVSMCLECGATVAGGADVIKKVQEGIIQPSIYNYVIADASLLPELSPIRGLLKDKLPRANKGTLTDNLQAAIAKFLHGLEYNCVKFEKGQTFGIISCDVGKVNMPIEHIEANYRAVVEDILKHRPSEERDFITWAWCFSPPSDERFALDLSKCLLDIKSETVTDVENVTKNTEDEKRQKEEDDEEEKETEAEEKV